MTPTSVRRFAPEIKLYERVKGKLQFALSYKLHRLHLFFFNFRGKFVLSKIRILPYQNVLKEVGRTEKLELRISRFCYMKLFFKFLKAA